jgi:hypothetical protein
MSTQELDEVRSVSRRRAWYKRRDILFIIVFFTVWAGWDGYGRFTGPGRMTDTLTAALDKNPKNLILLVQAKFPPERFHSNVYNELGIQRGTKKNTTLLVRVRPANVRWLSRQLWIKKLDLAPDGGRSFLN